ncbi:MAG TPA: plastocyanin/azurin family copper-binding protein [Gemmatimonadaceae bacterium]
MRILLSLTAALALMGCGGASYSKVTGPPQRVSTTSVALRNIAFSPSAIQVAPGATVQFTNNDGIAHNVTFSDGSITGATDFSTGSRSVVLPVAPGTYAFHCTIHPGMTGSVLVQ